MAAKHTEYLVQFRRVGQNGTASRTVPAATEAGALRAFRKLMIDETRLADAVPTRIWRLAAIVDTKETTVVETKLVRP